MSDATRRPTSNDAEGSRERRSPTADRIADLEPGVDPDSAGSSGVATEGVIPGEKTPAADRAGETEPGRPRVARARVWLIPAIVLTALCIAVFAFLVPVAPAVAWIGIASQAGILAAVIGCGFALPPSRRYRARVFAILMIVSGVSAIVLLLIILSIAWIGASA